MERTVTVRAFKTQQGTAPFFVFLIKSDVLLGISYVVSRSDDPDKGIQRIASKERLSEIAQFVDESKDVVFPNNLVINFNKNEKVIFRPDKDKPNEGDLIIPNRSNIAQVIDGQHRLLGMEKAKKTIPLLVIAFQGLSHLDQAKLFLTINSKQKGINTSLVYDLFSITRTAESVELIAIDIAKALNSDEDSPLKNMIKLTDARKRDKETLSLSALVVTLKKILKNKDIAFSNLDFQQQVLVLKNYFNCIQTMFPDAWGANRGYILTKTLGFSALMKTFPKVHLRCLIKQDVLATDINHHLIPWKGFDFSSKTWEGISGEAGAAKLANDLESKLNKLIQ